MKRVAIIGTSHDEQLFFEDALKSSGLALSFHATPAGIDLATEAISVFVRTKIGAAELAKLPQLKLIACRSTGYDNIDIELAKQKGITVANVPSYGGVTVAEFTIALLLMLSRRMLTVLDETNRPEPDRQAEQGFDLAGKTLGVIGTGAIGRGVARIAKGFGMTVIGYDLYPNTEEAQKIGFTYTSDPNMLIRASDVISLHMPATPQTKHFLNAERLKHLKPGAVVLNTARGDLIDTKALITALKQKHVGGAGLDVVEPGFDHALNTLPNVVLTNHNAYNTLEAIERINQMTADNITSFFAGKKVQTV